MLYKLTDLKLTKNAVLIVNTAFKLHKWYRGIQICKQYANLHIKSENL